MKTKERIITRPAVSLYRSEYSFCAVTGNVQGLRNHVLDSAPVHLPSRDYGDSFLTQ